MRPPLRVRSGAQVTVSGDSGAFEGQVRAVRPYAGRLIGRCGGVGDAERPGEFVLGRMAGQKHRLGASEPRKLERKHADHAAADDEDTLASHRRPDIEPVERTGERLAQGAVFRIEIGRQRDCLPRWEDSVFSEAAVAVDACGDIPVAQVDPPAQACVAAPTPVVGVADDARALGYVDAGSTTHDNTRELMPKCHRWGARELAPEEMAVGTANARRLDPNQHLAGTRLRYADVGHADVIGGHQSRCTHEFPLHSRHGAAGCPM